MAQADALARKACGSPLTGSVVTLRYEWMRPNNLTDDDGKRFGKKVARPFWKILVLLQVHTTIKRFAFWSHGYWQEVFKVG